MKSIQSRRAFTLIELLVVIAIIAILAAILFPVFAQAKAAAKKTADLSNVKQTNLATLLYANDSDDTLVQNGEGAVPAGAGAWSTMEPWTGQTDFYGYHWGAGAGGSGADQAPLGFMDPAVAPNWGRESQPYIKSLDMLASPGVPNDADPKFAPTKTAGAGKTSFVFNGCASRHSGTAISKPAETILFSTRATTVKEAICSPRRSTGFSDGALHANDADLMWVGFTWGRGGNYGFADGHAKYMNRSQVKFKNVGYFEWVNVNGQWVPPESNPTMKSDPLKNDNQWGNWGQCDVANVP